jgi:hypothetical protein
MRIVLIILLLANLILFFWGQGYTGQQAGREPDRLARQQAPEKLRIVPPAPAGSPSPDKTAFE